MLGRARDLAVISLALAWRAANSEPRAATRQKALAKTRERASGSSGESSRPIHPRLAPGSTAKQTISEKHEYPPITLMVNINRTHALFIYSPLMNFLMNSVSGFFIRSLMLPVCVTRPLDITTMFPATANASSPFAATSTS